jgi:hypothetical protein
MSRPRVYERPPGDSRIAWAARFQGTLPKVARLLGFHAALTIIMLGGAFSVIFITGDWLLTGIALFLSCLVLAVVLFWRCHHWHRWLALAAIAVPGWFWVKALLERIG